MLDELDLCIYIDDENEPKMKVGSFAKSAPNQIINLNKVVELVDTKLGKCEIFFKYKFHLNEEKTSSFSYKIEYKLQGL